MTNFSGGWSTDKKVGIANSFAYSQSVDFRQSPSQVSLLPQPVREDQGTVADLVQNEVMAKDGTIYAWGDTGKLYKRTSAGVWSMEANGGIGTFGMDYRQDMDAIFTAGDKSVNLYNQVTTAPAFQTSYYADSFSTYDNTDNMGFNVNSYQTDGNLTTLIRVATSPLSHGSTDIRYFQSDIEPLNKIAVKIAAKGTGDWTLTLQDGLNNTLATSTIVNADLVSYDWNEFEFTSATNDQVRIYVSPNARTYHIHVTSTVADGYVYSTGTNDLSTCDLMVYADRMVVTQNGMHPIARFQQFECIGNANYLSIWEPLSEPPTNAEWQRHYLTFPEEYEVCGLAVFNEFLAIALEKTTSDDNTPQEGIVAFWDGLTQYKANYFTKIPEGSPYGLHEYKNVLYYYAGGAWYAIPSVTSEPVKIRTMPFGENSYGTTNNTTKIYPYATTTRNGVQLMAYPSITTNESIDYGVYSWGQVDKNLPNSFGYSYLLSTGSQNYSEDNDLEIGMIKNFGDTLHISWRDSENGNYGVDVVDTSSLPPEYATVESLIFDNGYVAKEKEIDYIEATWLSPLPDGVEIQLKYSINRGDWVYSERFSEDNKWQETDGYARLDTFGSGENAGRFNEIQIGVDIYCGVGLVVPEIEGLTLTSLSFVFDDLNQEQLQ